MDPVDHLATARLTPVADEPHGKRGLRAGGDASATGPLRRPADGADTKPMRGGAAAADLGATDKLTPVGLTTAADLGATDKLAPLASTWPTDTRPISLESDGGASGRSLAGGAPSGTAAERLLAGPNPFEPVILPFDRSVDVPDVAAIHGDASRALLDAIAKTRADGRSRGLLLRGESGTGKTHLLRRVARGLGRQALFAAIDPIGDPERLARHILRRAVQELCAEGPDGATHLQDLAGALVAEAIYALAPGSEREALLDAILAAEPGFLQRDRALAARAVTSFSRALAGYEPLADVDVLKVLLQVRIEAISALARDWLRGVDLDEEDVIALGAQRTLAGEPEAEAALRTLAAGARLFRPLVLCFDQTETLRSLGGDRVVRALFEAIARLRALPGLVIVFTCLEDVWASSYRAHAEAVAAPPLGDGEIALRRLGPRELRAVVAARLERALAGVEVPYPTWPVPERTFAAFEDLSPREALEYCARSFEAMRARGAIGEIPPPGPRASAGAGASQSQSQGGPRGGPAAAAPQPPPARGPRDALAEAWEEALEGAALLEPDEETAVDGLFQLLRIGERGGDGWPEVRGLEREQGAASIVATLAGGAPTKVVVSDTRNGSSFAKLLERVLGWMGPRHRNRRAVLVRLADERDTWTKANERLRELERAGGRVTRPARGALDKLAAARSLLGKVAAGDVAAGGRAVSESEALAFLRDTPGLAAALAEVLGTGHGSGASGRRAGG